MVLRGDLVLNPYMQHTFVIPAYGQSPYLKQCIESLLAQSLQSNILLTTSTPSIYLEDIAKQYRLSYLINPVSNGGIANDWNFALQQAASPLVTIAHQDDVYATTYTEQVIESFTSTGDKPVLIAFTDYEDLVNDTIRQHSLNALVKRLLLLPFFLKRRIENTALKKFILLFGDPICCPSVTFNKTALEDFSFSTAYQCALDWLAWVELANRNGSFAYINQKLVQHRIHGESETTVQINNGTRLKEEQQIFELLWGKWAAKLITRLYVAGHQNNL